MAYNAASRPIGIFDSGIGGLTVAHAIGQALPHEQLVYFGDTAHLPYGDKSADAIRYYSLKIVKFLLEQDCKMIVIACNSASSTAFRVLLEFFQHKALFVDVVTPLVQFTAAQPSLQKVGIIATKATVGSGVYERALRALLPGLEVYSLATPLLVPLIEEGYFHNQISDAVIRDYLSVEGFNNIDALLLACTHYPLIRPDIEAILENRVKVWDSARVTALEVKRVLADKGLLSKATTTPNHRFYVSDFTHSFQATTRIFYPKGVHLKHCPIW